MGDKNLKTDIAVVGGGLTGLAAAVLAARRGFSVAHVAPKAAPDRRTSALMEPSTAFLQSSGLIPDAKALGTPLRQIRIIDATRRLIRAPETLFDSAEAGLEAFAWNFSNALLLERFAEAAKSEAGYQPIEAAMEAMAAETNSYRLTLSDGSEVHCGLVVGADGKGSAVRKAAGIPVREHKFPQSALVADLTMERPLEGTSVEFHYENGPFTLVPASGNKANLVWIDRTETLAEVRSSGDRGIAEAIDERSQNLFGTITLASPTFVFPLSTLMAANAASNGVVLVGEAAHAFPPIGAQGLNLGLRDVNDLIAALSESDRNVADWPKVVANAFAARRESDLLRTSQTVDMLFRSLLTDLLPAQALRAGGLWALKLVPALRRKAFAAGMGAR